MRTARAEAHPGEVESAEPTATHVVVRGDARDLSWIPDDSVHLVVTSPPYGLLKTYRDAPGQLGNGEDPTVKSMAQAYEERFPPPIAQTVELDAS